MIRIQYGDKGPRVVLIQIALSTRPPQTRLVVDGAFGEHTRQAVKALQRTLTRPPTGIVEGPEWQAMMKSMPFATFDHTDIDDFVTALRKQTLQQIAADNHQYGVVAMAELSKADAEPVSVGVGASNSIAVLVDRIVAAGRQNKIGLLRIFGHGGPGLQMIAGGRGVPGGADENLAALTAPIARRYRGLFARAAFAFQPYGSVELHGCRVAQNEPGKVLLKYLADAWQVPVTAGITRQHVGQGQTFRYEGPTLTAYPGHISLRQWATRVASLSAFSRA